MLPSQHDQKVKDFSNLEGIPPSTGEKLKMLNINGFISI